MKKHSLLIITACTLLTACDNTRTTDKTQEADRNRANSNIQARTTEQDRVNRDNDTRYARDERNMNAPTAQDQSETEADRNITQALRKQLMSDSRLSTKAKNIVIVTQNGILVLRGIVDSPEEKDAIANKAQNVSGVRRVDNQLEISR